MFSVRVLIALVTSIAMFLQAMRWWNAAFNPLTDSAILWAIGLLVYESIWSVLNVYVALDLAARLNATERVWNRVGILLLLTITVLLMLAQLSFAAQIFGEISWE